MVTPKITKIFLMKVQRNTNDNAHGVNLQFVARYIKSKLAPKFAKVNNAHARTGYLTESLLVARTALSKKLKKELMTKYPKDYTKVWSRL